MVRKQTAAGQPAFDYILGLDLGASSIGWAVIKTSSGTPIGLARAGVRVFEAGLAGDLESGRAEPRNVKRRLARQARRQTDRRRRRLRRVYRILQRAGLLPAGESGDVIPALDGQLFEVHAAATKSEAERHRLAQVMPLWLRARALDHKLERQELGRALFHLAQRRGFLSNRKSAPKEDEDEGKLKHSISELAEEVTGSGARTLGEYLSRLDPEEARIRTRPTSRVMYESEFEAIWETQARYAPQLLTEALRIELREAIFYQRPLKSAAGLIGACELEPDRHRAPWALLDAQRFRLLQMANNTRLIDLETGEERPLAGSERERLVSALERQAQMTFPAAKKLLGFKPKQVRFNLEVGGEARFLGNRSAAAIAEIFGEQWWNMSQGQREAVVEDVLTIESEDALAHRGFHHWKLSRRAADALAVVRLQPGYCSFSRVALTKLLPHLEQGLSVAEACDLAYPDRRASAVPHDELARLEEALPSLRNPVVGRVLTELRKVVNAIVRAYGKPSVVRIELAREVKRSRRGREEAARRMRQQEQRRKVAAALLLQDAGIEHPTRDDIERVLLWQECGGQCPYTGKPISFGKLFGPHPEFDVEHILPFSRSFDNSFVNKTLCHAEENRRIKTNRTPYEAYHDTPRYDEILGRVRAFSGDKAREKLRRFQAAEIEGLDEFTSRELNDTRWASRLAADYLGTLFGGRVDANGTLRVQVSSGQLTSFLRGAWELNRVLSSNGAKSREDHRHHAIDAVTIALTAPGAVKALSDSSEKAWAQRRRLFSHLATPWPNFDPEVRDVIGGLNVSHRADRRVSGALHDETLYGIAPEKGAVVVRKPVHALTEREAHGIVDEAVRTAVQEKRRLLGDFKKLEQDPPTLISRAGKRVPIRRVRIRKHERVVRVGKGPRQRQVIEGSNHHIEIVAEVDAEGRETRWIGRVVSMLQASVRLASHPPVPVVDRTVGGEERFKFSLCRGDGVLLGDEENAKLWIVQKLSANQTGATTIVLKPPADARKVNEIPTQGRIHSPNTLRKAGARKVVVDPVGTVRDARD
ncbi:MAG: type II CRISPR RNA-guided endonuclease Cas9 [Acidobacteria bacterium]|nr:MAG: type II CRISPR RNA-guided endonuclease Cas9 [Acidobacteriota bacterium]